VIHRSEFCHVTMFSRIISPMLLLFDGNNTLEIDSSLVRTKNRTHEVTRGDGTTLGRSLNRHSLVGALSVGGLPVPRNRYPARRRVWSTG